MRADEATLHYPLMGFVADGEIVGFSDLENLTICHRSTFERGRHVGIELVDAELGHWVVRSAELQAPAPQPSFWKRIFSAPPNAELDLELEKLGTLSIEQMRDRVCAGLIAAPQGSYVDEEDFDTMLAELRAAGSVREIFEIFAFDLGCGL